MSKIEIKKGDEISVIIEAVSTSGEGIARLEDHIIFVPNVKEDQEVEVKVNRVINKICFADVLNAEQPKEEISEEVQENQESNVSTADLAAVKEVDAVVGLEDAPIEAPRPEDFGVEPSKEELPPLPVENSADDEDIPPPPVSEDEEKIEDFGDLEVPKPPN